MYKSLPIWQKFSYSNEEKGRGAMLIVKSYFLSEFERFETERKVLELSDGITEEELFALDDQELVQRYNECSKEKLVTL